ncbi:TRM11 family SAM-dependent methyltransferase [Streptomyces sp. NPDC012935]|uniref:TRM11 family SAM-dependent methyltransferase n=1 Tax=Streptomyces sp. NPDC012935 TaxID=3364857 RepID=UPI0036896844
MLRFDDRPLHRRAYKQRTVPGTLHPPLAAAMAQPADIRPGHVVIDPCCGAGTLLIEAATAQPDARCHGFDLAADAVAATRTNAGELPVAIRRCDAGRLPLPEDSVDRVLCNALGHPGPRPRPACEHPSRWWTELRRVLAPGGMAVLLLPDRDDLATAIRHHFTPVHVQRLRCSGRNPSLFVWRRQGLRAGAVAKPAGSGCSARRPPPSVADGARELGSREAHLPGRRGRSSLLWTSCAKWVRVRSLPMSSVAAKRMSKCSPSPGRRDRPCAAGAGTRCGR